MNKRVQLFFGGLAVALGMALSAATFVPSRARAEMLKCQPVWDPEEQIWHCSRQECQDPHWCCAPCMDW
jgi:hypothetical protein